VPERIQLRRVAGWRKPDGAIVVSRPTRWGNPITLRRAAKLAPTGTSADGLYWTAEQRRIAVELHCNWLTLPEPLPVVLDFEPERRAWVLAHIPDLAGHDLACWCPLDQPCHADTLLKLANPSQP
jgi:hypothetical protein